MQRSLHGRIRIGGKTSFTTDCRSLARDYVAGNFAWISYGSMRMHDAIWDRVFGLASHDDFHHPLPVKGNLSKHKIQHLEQTLRNFPAHVRDCSFLYVILPLLCRAASCSSSFFCMRNESSPPGGVATPLKYSRQQRIWRLRCIQFLNTKTTMAMCIGRFVMTV